MKLSPPRSARARPGRCYVPTQPLTRRGNGAEGAEIVQEIPGELGVLLWATLRDVMLYLSAPAAERDSLFPAGAAESRRSEIARCAVDSALWAPLLVVAEMMERPAEAGRARVAHACRAVARWAEGEAPAARLAFSQAAALARPGDARLALATARLARDAADHARAETWFRRAIKLARGKDWESYIRAFLGLGIMYYRGGNYPAAGVLAGRALRAARRRRLPSLQGDAHHDMFLIAIDTHRMEEAYAHAQAALEVYGAAHPRVPYLAHDVGVFWSQQGRFDLALEVFEAALPHFTAPAARTRVLANLVRAAAGMGDRARYERGREMVVALLAATPECASIEAEMLMQIARADNLMADWRRAAEAAERAAQLAAARGEAHTRIMAEVELECARAGRMSQEARPAEAAPLARQAARLALEIGASLERRRALAGGAAVA